MIKIQSIGWQPITIFYRQSPILIKVEFSGAEKKSRYYCISPSSPPLISCSFGAAAAVVRVPTLSADAMNSLSFANHSQTKFLRLPTSPNLNV